MPVLAGIFPLTSYRLALRLHNEVPGIIVPDELQQALDEAGADAAEVGMAHAQGAARRRARPLRRRLRRRAVPPADLGARAARLAAFAPDDLRRDETSCFWTCRTSCGGATWSSRCSTSDCRTSRCTFGWPGIWSATAPTTQTSASPQTAPTASPPSESSSRSGGSSRSPPRIERASIRASDLEHDDADDRAREPDERRVARVDSGGEEVRRDPRADDRAADEPDERERGRDEPAPVAAGAARPTIATMIQSSSVMAL